MALELTLVTCAKNMALELTLVTGAQEMALALTQAIAPKIWR